jgi:hypothetical protein
MTSHFGHVADNMKSTLKKVVKKYNFEKFFELKF